MNQAKQYEDLWYRLYKSETFPGSPEWKKALLDYLISKELECHAKELTYD